jgi:hypothetical protein
MTQAPGIVDLHSAGRRMFDPIGHYGRPDLLGLRRS